MFALVVNLRVWLSHTLEKNIFLLSVIGYTSLGQLRGISICSADRDFIKEKQNKGRLLFSIGNLLQSVFLITLKSVIKLKLIWKALKI